MRYHAYHILVYEMVRGWSFTAFQSLSHLSWFSFSQWLAFRKALKIRQSVWIKRLQGFHLDPSMGTNWIVRLGLPIFCASFEICFLCLFSCSNAFWTVRILQVDRKPACTTSSILISARDSQPCNSFQGLGLEQMYRTTTCLESSRCGTWRTYIEFDVKENWQSFLGFIVRIRIASAPGEGGRLSKVALRLGRLRNMLP